MKLNICILLTLSVITLKASVPDSIPNAGLERWFVSQWFEFPEAWNTNNTQIYTPVVKDTDAYAGSFAMKLISQAAIPHADCNFPITTHPSNLTCVVKNQILINDSAVIVVRLYYQGNLVDSGYQPIYGGLNPMYSPVIIPITQNVMSADSCQIWLTGGIKQQSEISFDNFEFDFGLKVNGLPDRQISIFPNPFTEHLQIDLEETNDNYSIEILNSIGQRQLSIEKIVKESYIVDAKRRITLNTAELPSGIWILRIGNNSNFKSVITLKN